MQLVPTLFLIAIAAGGWNHFLTRPVARASGTLAPGTPLQVERAGLPAFSIDDYRITAAAEFSVEARVLATETYRSGREADVSPIDLALGWGPMSDSAVLDGLKISQGNRFYRYRWSGQPPIPAPLFTLRVSMPCLVERARKQGRRQPAGLPEPGRRQDCQQCERRQSAVQGKCSRAERRQ